MPAGPLWRPLLPRGDTEEHRVSTPLELLFDLCFVVAVSFAAEELHRELAADHVGAGLLGFGSVFFAIWWAWTNVTWFASAYDNDDVLYRLAMLVTITGALILAAGVPRAFADGDFLAITLGYVVMRLVLVAQWLRVARADPPRRRMALRYVVGVTVVQVGWVARLGLPERLLWPSFLVLVLADLAVPVAAEWVTTSPWHTEHIAERYGLFTLIVLGESVLAVTVAVQAGLDGGAGLTELIAIAGAGLLIVFSMWWVYFDVPGQVTLGSLRRTITWGYGHLFVFGSAAAVGAGLAVAVDASGPGIELGVLATGVTVGLPVSAYLLAVWILHVAPRGLGVAARAFPVAALLTAVLPLVAGSVVVAVWAVAVVSVGLVVVLALAGRSVLPAD